MGTNIGAFVGPLGLAPWTRSGPDLGLLFGMSFALRDHVLFESFSPGLRTSIEYSTDDGATWRELDGLPSTGVYEMAVARDVLCAAGNDGLLRRSISAVSVPDVHAAPGLRFTLAGSQPIGDEVRFRFELPEPGPVVIEFFDVAGRRVTDAIRGSFAAGPNEIAWDARGLGRGIFLARLTAGSRRAAVRLIRVR